MKTYTGDYGAHNSATSKEPRFVVQLSWDSADTDYTYLTSSTSARVPTDSPPVDTIHNSVLKISGQTQKINPDIATSTIGAVTIDLLDVDDNTVSPALDKQVSARINTKLDAGDGLRGKIVRVYVGYHAMPFTDYDLRLTYIVESITYRDGVYTLRLTDINRTTKRKIFTPVETTLSESINATQKTILVTSINTDLFQAVTHGAEWFERPGQTLTYVKIEDEVIAITGPLTFSTASGWYLTVVERGAFGTSAVNHDVDSTTDDNRKPKVVEHIYLEGPALKVMYAILTGTLLNGTSPENTLPDHWHVGIDSAFVRLTDFQGIGVDLWNPVDDTGRRVRIQNPGPQDGKRYIEKEMLLWLGCFMPIYSTGELGIRKLAGVLSDASYIDWLDKYSIKSYGDLTHDMRSVINDIRVEWNWNEIKEEFTKNNLFIDAASVSKHGTADEKTFSFKTVHTGLHTDEDLLTYFDVLRDRYSGPPLKLTLSLMPSKSFLEVGDIVRVELDKIYDFTVNAFLDRSFEIQQVTTNWITGNITVQLFGSSQRAGELQRTALTSVLLDTYYTSLGTELSTVLTIVAGQITANGTLTGHATSIDNAAAVYYYNGDLQINSGVTVTITENVQLRIKGLLQVNGTIDGVGNGATGGAATTQYVGGSTSHVQTDPRVEPYVPALIPDFDYGEVGYFGSTMPSASLWIRSTEQGFSATSTIQESDSLLISRAGIVVWINYVDMANQYPPIISRATDTVPFFQLSNDQQTNTVSGYPSQLRGNSGTGGVPLIVTHHSAVATATNYMVASGGAGGNGGAGLLIVARGMAFGLSGKIDLSGGDSSVGGSAVEPVTGKRVYAGSGAPGAPGVLLITLDGAVTNPDVTESRFIANYGVNTLPSPSQSLVHYDSPFAVIFPRYLANGFSLPDYYRFNVDPVLPWFNNHYVGPDMSATSDISVFDAAHRIQYIPTDQTPQEEGTQLPADVIGFSATQNGDVVVFSWDPDPNVFNAGFEIRYAPQTAATFDSAVPVTEVTKGTSITTAIIPPGDWRFYIVGVNDATGKYSENPATADLTVTNALDIISQIAQAPTWTGTLTNFVLHHTGVLVPKSQDADSSQSGNTDWALDNVFNEFVHNAYETCTYESAEIDIGFDDDVRVWGDIESALGPLESGLADPKLSIDYRLAAGTYDGFESWTIGNLTARYFKHKLTLTTSVGKAYIKEFLPTVDVLEHTQSATGVTVAASGGTTITYPTPFHTAPFVRTFMTATSALIPVRSSVTSTSFLAQVFDSTGADVGGTIDWEAIGS